MEDDNRKDHYPLLMSRPPVNKSLARRQAVPPPLHPTQPPPLPLPPTPQVNAADMNRPSYRSKLVPQSTQNPQIAPISEGTSTEPQLQGESTSPSSTQNTIFASTCSETSTSLSSTQSTSCTTISLEAYTSLQSTQDTLLSSTSSDTYTSLASTQNTILSPTSFDSYTSLSSTQSASLTPMLTEAYSSLPSTQNTIFSTTSSETYTSLPSAQIAPLTPIVSGDYTPSQNLTNSTFAPSSTEAYTSLQSSHNPTVASFLNNSESALANSSWVFQDGVRIDDIHDKQVHKEPYPENTQNPQIALISPGTSTKAQFLGGTSSPSTQSAPLASTTSSEVLSTSTTLNSITTPTSPETRTSLSSTQSAPLTRTSSSEFSYFTTQPDFFGKFRRDFSQ